MAKILGEKGALAKNSILEYQDFEVYGRQLIPLEKNYEFFVLDSEEEKFLELSGMKEYKVLTEDGIYYLQTTDKSLFLSDDQLSLKKGYVSHVENKDSTNFNIKKSLLKITSSAFQRWDLYSSTKEINSSFLNIFYDIRFDSLTKENFSIDMLKYTAWHPIFQDVFILIEPQAFRWNALEIL